MRLSYAILGVVFFATAVLLVATSRAVLPAKPAADSKNLCLNSDFRDALNNKPVGYILNGAATYRYLGDPGTDNCDFGVVLDSSKSAASISQRVDNVGGVQGKWYRFTFRGLPEAAFAVANDSLEIKVQYFGADGKTQYDGKAKKLYAQIEKARKDLTVNGDGNRRGAEVWQTYSLDFVVPFSQVKQFDLSVGFDKGAGKSGSGAATLLVSQFSLIAIADPPGQSTTHPAAAALPVYDHLIPLGGRWFYAAVSAGESAAPAQFDGTNADRLLYHDFDYSAPFAGNTGAWLHKGNLDAQGTTVTEDRYVADNLTITVDGKSLMLHSHGLPNHPTGNFPGENPNSIQEQNATYYLPLNPAVNPKHIVTDKTNSNGALNMGPIGVAINGVVFFNPFDAGSQDASNIMDYCCGHPNQFGQYHYHKYPVCVNSPWADEGKQHSPLIGFAFDGFPIYGPYESADVMAKDVKGERALNDFNLHFDKDRGWHYHVTPGAFPYLIGGYWGTIDPRDVRGGGGRRRGGAGGGGGPPM